MLQDPTLYAWMEKTHCKTNLPTGVNRVTWPCYTTPLHFTSSLLDAWVVHSSKDIRSHLQRKEKSISCIKELYFVWHSSIRLIQNAVFVSVNALTCFQRLWGCRYTRWPPGGTHMDTHIHSAPFWRTQQLHEAEEHCYHSSQEWQCFYVSTLIELLLHYDVTVIYNDPAATLWDLNERPWRWNSLSVWSRDLWQLRQSRSTVLQAQNARESHVSLTIPAKALVPGILVKRYLEQWLPWTRLVRSP